MIKKDTIIQAQNKWSASIIKISSVRDNYDLCLQYTDDFLNELYAFDKGIVLFKPTKAKDEQFRFTKEKALSYFIAGKKKICKEDVGFAIHPWKNITFNNSWDAFSFRGSISWREISIFLKVSIDNKSVTIFLVNTALPAPIIVSLVIKIMYNLKKEYY